MTSILTEKPKYLKINECIKLIKNNKIVNKIIGYVDHLIYDSNDSYLCVLVFLINGTYQTHEYWTNNTMDNYEYSNTLKYKTTEYKACGYYGNIQQINKLVENDYNVFIQSITDIEIQVITWLINSVESTYMFNDDLSMTIVLF